MFYYREAERLVEDRVEVVVDRLRFELGMVSR